MTSLADDLGWMFGYAKERPEWYEGFLDGYDEALGLLERNLHKPEEVLETLRNMRSVLKEHLVT